ncbi:MAG: YcaO-like family protein, partial [Alphaproteobacteria bacterium]
LPRRKGCAFDTERPTRWIEGYDLLDGRPLWVPYEIVQTDYTFPAPPQQGCFPLNTNGLGSGNHILEAICHGLCEVVERDATSIWLYRTWSSKADTRIRLETVDDPTCQTTMDRFAEAKIELAVWDISGDVGVPAFFCLVCDSAAKSGHLGAGAGCHPCREIALLRALTEAAQTRLTYITGARDDMVPDEFTDGGMLEKRAIVDDFMGRGQPHRNFREIATRVNETIREDLDWLVERLGAVEVGPIIVVDLTNPEIGIPVVRVVVPGLEAPIDDDVVPGPRARATVERPPTTPNPGNA